MPDVTKAFDARPLVDEDLEFRDFVVSNMRGVYLLARHLTGSHQDAEDLSQEVFMKAHAALSEFRGDARASSWLYRITVNTYLNRRRSRVWQLSRRWSVLTEATAVHSPEAEMRLDEQRLHRDVDRALGELSARERVAFVLRHCHDLTVRETADAMGVADGTVKALVYRAVRKLRRKLRPYRPEQS